MGDTQQGVNFSAAPSVLAEDPVCYSDKNSSSLPDPSNSNNLSTSVDNLNADSWDLNNPNGVCAPDPYVPDPVDTYLSQTPSLLREIDLKAPVCRGEFKNPDDYLRVFQGAQREAKLGATLARMPKSPEEGIKADPKVVIYAGVAYPLDEVWKGLPEQVRVYLSTMKDTPDLGIAYELEDKATGIPARWHVFEMSAATPVAPPSPAVADAEKPDPQTTHKKQGKAPLGIAIAGAAMMGTTLLRTADGNPPASPPGSSGGKTLSTPPTGEPAVNVSVGSAIAGTALMIGVSLGIRKLFPDLKSEPQFFLNLSSMYGVNYVMFRAGLLPNYNWKTFTGQIPGMYSLGFIGAVLVDGVGRATGNKNFQFGAFGHELATMGLTLGAFYTIASSETLLPLLTGGTRTIGGLSFASAAGGAGVLGGIGQGLKIAGYFGIANLAIGAIKWGYFHASGDADTPEGRLEDFISDIVRERTSTNSFLGKYAGSLWNGFIGHIQDGLVGALCSLSDDASRGRRMERDEIKSQMVDGSKEFGTSVRSAVALLVAQNIKLENGQIDWTKVEQGLRDMYGQNPEGVENVYKLLEHTGFLATDAQEIKDSVAKDGTIANRSALEAIAKVEIQKLYDRNQKRLLAMQKSIGAIKTVGNQTFFTPPEDLTDEQKIRMEKEVMPTALETQFYGEALKQLSPAGAIIVN